MAMLKRFSESGKAKDIQEMKLCYLHIVEVIEGYKPAENSTGKTCYLEARYEARYEAA